MDGMQDAPLQKRIAAKKTLHQNAIKAFVAAISKLPAAERSGYVNLAKEELATAKAAIKEVDKMLNGEIKDLKKLVTLSNTALVQQAKWGGIVDALAETSK